MEAKLVETLPEGGGWQFEPKWDGFRCLAYRAEDDVQLMSKSGKPLQRFFPEVAARFAKIASPRFALDGELIIETGGVLAFDALQARLHPAASRIAKLSVATPARFMAFDLLDDGTPLVLRPLGERRGALEKWHATHGDDDVLLSPATADRDAALAWLAATGGALDGVIAKRLDDPYRSGERAMLKVKVHRTADCVVGGWRAESGGDLVASLLLGLYDADGRLNHVGHTSALGGLDRAALTAELRAAAGEGFDGDAPGGPSRWASARSAEWFPLRPERVVEVRFDQVTAGRFRHGTGFMRWRPDKAPHQCGCEQLAYALRPAELDL